MGVKIKKETQAKAIVSTEEDLKSKLTLAIPAMGIILLAVMGTYASSPIVAGNAKAQAVFWAIAAVGAVYAFCMYGWKLTADSKGLRVVRIGGERTVLYANIKRVEVTKIGGEIAWYTIIKTNDRKFVRMYPVMTNCGALLERLRKLGIKIVEN